jgi:hypothetical protein
MAAIFNLNHPANTVHWHFISLSVSNVIVIVLMFAVFAAAILIPFPGHRSGEPKTTTASSTNPRGD